MTWSFDESYAYIIGMGSSDEFLVVVQDPYNDGDLSVWNLGLSMDYTNTLIPDPTANYRLYAVRGSSFTQIQVYPAKSTY